MLPHLCDSFVFSTSLLLSKLAYFVRSVQLLIVQLLTAAVAATRRRMIVMLRVRRQRSGRQQGDVHGGHRCRRCGAGAVLLMLSHRLARIETDADTGAAVGHVEQSLRIAHEFVHVPFAGHLLHDALLVVVAQTARQFVVVHGRPVFLDAPATGHLLRFDQLELHAAARPTDTAGTVDNVKDNRKS